jgi:hypothetical protein
LEIIVMIYATASLLCKCFTALQIIVLQDMREDPIFAFATTVACFFFRTKILKELVNA